MPRAIAPLVTTTGSRPVAVQLGELVADPGEHVQPRLAALVDDDARPELYDQASHRRRG